MAGRITLWGAEQLLKTSFGKAFEPTSTFYLALVRNNAPTPYISGSELDEPTASYSRFAIPNNTANWMDPGQKQTVAFIGDVEIAVTADWGNISYWALCNASTGGYLYACGSLENTITVSAGDTITITEGDLVITIGPFFNGDF